MSTKAKLRKLEADRDSITWETRELEAEKELSPIRQNHLKNLRGVLNLAAELVERQQRLVKMGIPW